MNDYIWHTADFILLDGKLQPNIALQFDYEGRLLDVADVDTIKPGDRLRYQGALCPGLINAHCHLELSHLKGKIPRGTGFAGFAERLVAQRYEADETLRTEARKKAERKVWYSGARAVFDVCNDYADAQAAQDDQEPFVFNFLEVFGLTPESGAAALENARTHHLRLGEKYSALAPHAPFSVLPETMRALSEHAIANDAPVSFHFMESEGEMELFAHNTGELAEFFRKTGLTFQPPRAHPLDYAADYFPSESRLLLVHCVECGAEELQCIQEIWPDAHICLCPRSNEYIHGKLPDFALFDYSRTCFGTDSLASNDDLNLIEEIKVAQAVYPELTTDTLLNCLTAVPAKFMRWNEYGALRKGAKPGLVNVSPLEPETRRLTPETKAFELL